jgi:hypothetical protein
VPGDFVCAGISYGVGAKLIYEFTDFDRLGKTPRWNFAERRALS